MWVDKLTHWRWTGEKRPEEMPPTSKYHVLADCVSNDVNPDTGKPNIQTIMIGVFDDDQYRPHDDGLMHLHKKFGKLVNFKMVRFPPLSKDAMEIRKKWHI